MKKESQNPSTMQAAAAVCFKTPVSLKSSKSLVPRSSPKPHKTILRPRAITPGPPDTSTFDYSSSTSVFPAEACDTLGGVACDAQIFPEVKLAVSASSGKAKAASEDIDREYLEYDLPKTVFPGEACDDLGGEFCEAEYQEGVFNETALSQ